MNSFLLEVEKLPKGHPVKVYYQEAELIKKLISEIKAVNASEEFQKYYNIYNELSTIDLRFKRKENQLFPYLEKHGWNGPSQGMWSFHDTIREQFRLLNKHNEDKNLEMISENLPHLLHSIEHLMYIEDHRLFPNAMELLTKEDWEEFYEGDEEIGWMTKRKPAPYPEQVSNYVHPSEDFTQRELSFSLDNTFHYDEGYMTPEQVNLLLKFLPIDITYVDENDKVIFTIEEKIVYLQEVKV
jgi:Uncharacterized conserved protein